MMVAVQCDDNPNKVEVTELPAQEKPRPKTKVFPLSGGQRTELRRGYAGGRERSPAVHLLKLSSHGITLTGSSGPALIRWEEVAAALAAKSPVGVTNAVVDQNPFNLKQVETRLELIEEKLSPEAYHFVLAKFLKDTKSREMTYYYAWVNTALLAKEKGWKNKTGKEIFRNVARLAVDMHLDLQSYCWCAACNGAGANRLGKCKRCDGTGKREAKHAELARIIGISQTNYTKLWVPRVSDVVDMLEGWEREAITHLYLQLVQN